jgi:hypothetical protein
MKNISEKQFKAFIAVRDSGKTNMFDTTAVLRLSRGVVDKASCMIIVSNFDALQKKYA